MELKTIYGPWRLGVGVDQNITMILMSHHDEETKSIQYLRFVKASDFNKSSQIEKQEFKTVLGDKLFVATETLWKHDISTATWDCTDSSFGGLGIAYFSKAGPYVSETDI